MIDYQQFVVIRHGESETNATIPFRPVTSTTRTRSPRSAPRTPAASRNDSPTNPSTWS